MATTRYVFRSSRSSRSSPPIFRYLLSQPSRLIATSTTSPSHHQPEHNFSKPNELLGSWDPPKDPKDAQPKLAMLRRDYAKQVRELRQTIRIPGQVTLLHHSTMSTIGSQRFWYSSTPEPTGKETSQDEDGQKDVGNGIKNAKGAEDNGDSKTVGRKEDESTSSDSDVENDLSFDELVKLVNEKEELLKLKHKEFEQMKDKFLRSYAELENVMARTKREAENSKKYAIQNFAKSLLDVSDNLGRASSVVKESFSKLDSSKDEVGAVSLLKTLLEGVEMTEKQLAEVFRKYGLEKYEPLNEQFDPNKHFAIFQVPDGSKPPGTVAAVLKAGYMLHDRIIRPAEVGVTQALETESNQSS